MIDMMHKMNMIVFMSCDCTFDIMLCCRMSYDDNDVDTIVDT